MTARHHIKLFIGILSVLLLLASTVVSSKPVAADRTLEQLSDVPILNYHMVGSLHHALCVTPSDFDEQMAYLAEEGYHTISPDDLIGYLKVGKQLPDKPILITFDDGYVDNYENAYPILKKYGFTATIFLVTGKISEEPGFLTWDQVREMKSQGFSFGSHTVNHVPLNLNKMTPDEIRTELLASREKMKQELGELPTCFAYPTGARSLEIQDLVKSCGYEAAFSIRYGQAGTDSNLFALERIPIFKSDRTFRSFYFRLNGASLLERLGIVKN